MPKFDCSNPVATIQVYRVSEEESSVPFRAVAYVGNHEMTGSGYFVEQAVDNALAPLILNHYNEREWSENTNKFWDNIRKRQEERERQENAPKRKSFLGLFKGAA